jgi:hypothetical protein
MKHDEDVTGFDMAKTWWLVPVKFRVLWATSLAGNDLQEQ